MNINDYLKNPMGAGSSVLMLSQTRSVLNEQFETLRKRMDVIWYDLNDKYYVAHVKVPSRRHEKLYYDVVFSFLKDSIGNSALTINNASCRIFSNCPSFTYNYAYIYAKKDEIIPWLKVKYAREILKKDAVVKNPHHILNYERSVYLAMVYLTSEGHNYVSRIRSIARTTKDSELIKKNIKSNTEIEEINSAFDKAKRNEVKKEKPKPSTQSKDTKPTSNSKNKVKKTTTAKKTQTVKKSSKTKKL